MLQLLFIILLFFSFPQNAQSALCIKESDGTPDNCYWQMIVQNNTLTDNGDATASYDPSGGTGGDNVTIDGASVVDPDFASSGDIDFVLTGSTVTANINAGSVGADELDEAGVEVGLEAVLDLQDLQGAVTDAQVPDNITISLASTATALAANGSNCQPGTSPLGVDASGATEDCLESQAKITSVFFNENFLEAVTSPADSAFDVYDSGIANAPFTFEAWVYTRSNGRSSLGTIVNHGHAANAGYQLHVYAGNSTTTKIGANVRHGDGSDGQQSTSADGAANGSLPMHEWAHVLFTYNEDGDKLIKTYVNGAEISYSSQTAGTGDVVDDSAQVLYIGNKTNGSVTFDGMIRGVRIYHGKALTAAEVLNNYAGEPTPGATAYFPFSEGSGSVISDVIGGNIATTGTIATSVFTEGNLLWHPAHISLNNFTVSGESASAGILRLLEDTDSGANFASFQVPALSANTVYTLPANDGDSNEFLSTNGSGTLDWIAPVSVTDSADIDFTLTGLDITGVLKSLSVDSANINWTDVDAQEIKRAGINWNSLTNDVKLTGINWDAFWTDSASGINWGKVPGATTDYVLKRTASGINWQASSGGAETNSLETITTGIASTEIPIGTAADTVVYAALSGDVTMTNAGVVSIGNDKVVEADLKAVDAASDEDILTYESTTGDFEWHTISEMIALMSQGALPNDSVVEADLKAVDSPNDEECLTYETTTGDFEWQSCGSGGGGAKIIQLNPYSAKITGAFVTASISGLDTATQGAQIDAGDGNWRVLFDATTDEAIVFYAIVPDNYTSTPVVNLLYSLTSATTLEVEWEAALMCVSPGDSADVGTASFAAGATGGGETVPGTAGYIDTLESITPTDDSCAAGDLMYVYVSTDADDATNDDATGDRELVGAYVSYT